MSENDNWSNSEYSSNSFDSDDSCSSSDSDHSDDEYDNNEKAYNQQKLIQYNRHEQEYLDISKAASKTRIQQQRREYKEHHKRMFAERKAMLEERANKFKEEMKLQASKIRDAEESEIRKLAVSRDQLLYYQQHQLQISKKKYVEEMEINFRSEMEELARLEYEDNLLEKEREKLRINIATEETNFKNKMAAAETDLQTQLDSLLTKLNNDIKIAQKEYDEKSNALGNDNKQIQSANARHETDIKDLQKAQASEIESARDSIYKKSYETNARKIFEQWKKGKFGAKLKSVNVAAVNALFDRFESQMQVFRTAHEKKISELEKTLNINEGKQNDIFNAFEKSQTVNIFNLNTKIKTANERKKVLENVLDKLKKDNDGLEAENKARQVKIDEYNIQIDKLKEKLLDLKPLRDKITRLKEESKQIIEKYKTLHKTEEKLHTDNKKKIEEDFQTALTKANVLRKEEVKKTTQLAKELSKLEAKLNDLLSELAKLEEKLKKKMKVREELFKELEEHENKKPETRDLIAVPKVFHSCVRDGLNWATGTISVFGLWEQSIGSMVVKALIRLWVPGCQVQISTKGKKNPLLHELGTFYNTKGHDAYDAIPKWATGHAPKWMWKEMAGHAADFIDKDAKAKLAKKAGQAAANVAGYAAGKTSAGFGRGFNSIVAGVLAGNLVESGLMGLSHGAGALLGGHCYIIETILIALMSKKECDINRHRAFFYNRDASVKDKRVRPGWNLGNDKLNEEYGISPGGMSIDDSTFDDDMLKIFGVSPLSNLNYSPEMVNAWLNNRRRLRFVRDKDRSVYDYYGSSNVGFWLSKGLENCTDKSDWWGTGTCYANNLTTMATSAAELTKNLGYWVKGNAFEVLSPIASNQAVQTFLGIFGINSEDFKAAVENDAPLCPDGCISGKSFNPLYKPESGDAPSGGRETNGGIDYGLWLKDLNTLLWYWREENEQYDGAAAVLYIDIEPPGKTYWPFYIENEFTEEAGLAGVMKTKFPKAVNRNERLMIDEMIKKDTSNIVTDKVKTLHLENEEGVAIADVNQIKADAMKKFENMKKKILNRKYVNPSIWGKKLTNGNYLPRYLQRIYKKMDDAGFQDYYKFRRLYKYDVMLKKLEYFLKEWRSKEKKLINKLNGVEKEIETCKTEINKKKEEIAIVEQSIKTLEELKKDHELDVEERKKADRDAALKTKNIKIKEEDERHAQESKQLEEQKEGEQTINKTA